MYDGLPRPSTCAFHVFSTALEGHRTELSYSCVSIMSKNGERFTSRWGMMLAMLGMAVGTGNIWRFPRITASNGGGEFLVAWVVFLFFWSVPLILLEFGMGRMTRCGPVKAFIQIMGPRWAWMGAFAVFVTSSITFERPCPAVHSSCSSFF